MNSGFDQKVANVVAIRMANDIQRLGWPVGEKLGVERALLKRFGVSRAPFREAVRILEWQGLVRAQAGAWGGLIIQAPALSAVANIVKTYLELADVSYDEVREAHTIVLNYGLEMAIARMTPARANGIRKLLRKPRSAFRSRDQEGLAISLIYNTIVEIADIPSLSMLDFMFSRLTADFGHQARNPVKEWEQMITRVWAAAERLAVCVISRDLAGAQKALQEERRVVDESVKRLERYNHHVWNTRSFLRGDYRSPTLAREGGGKAATALLYRITASIRRGEMVPGTTLGTESKLLKKFDASRAVFREALRSLEFFGVATVKRGGGGGLTVAVPNPTSTINTAVLYLKYLRFDDARLRAFLLRLERETMRLAAARASHSELLSLLEAARIAARAGAKDVQTLVTQLRRQLIALAENRALEFIVMMLTAAGAPPPRNRRPTIGPRGRARLKKVCRTVEQAAAGRSPEDLSSALQALYDALRQVVDHS